MIWSRLRVRTLPPRLYRGIRPPHRPPEWIPPHGKNQLLLAVSDAHALRFRRFYCYVGEIQFPPEHPDGAIACETPAVVHDAIKLWRRYGPMREEAFGSCLYFRVVALPSGRPSMSAWIPSARAIQSPASSRPRTAIIGRLDSPGGGLSRLPNGNFGRRVIFLTAALGLTATRWLYSRPSRRIILRISMRQTSHMLG